MASPDATAVHQTHDCTCTPAAPTPNVRAFLHELVRWCSERQYRLSEARDSEDAAYRRGWNSAVQHVAEHAREHAEAGAEQAKARLESVETPCGTVQR